MRADDSGCRRDADRRNAALRAVEPHQLLLVVMPVQQQIASVLGDERAKHWRIDQPFHVVPRRGDRRVMYQHHAEERLAR